MVMENNPKLLKRLIISKKVMDLQILSLFFCEHTLNLYNICKDINSNTSSFETKSLVNHSKASISWDDNTAVLTASVKKKFT